MRKIDEHHHISLVLGHIFKDNEGIYAITHISTTLGNLNTSTLVALFKSVELFNEKNMSDYWIKVNRKLTGFGGRLTVFGSNRNNTAQISSEINISRFFSSCTCTDRQKISLINEGATCCWSNSSCLKCDWITYDQCLFLHAQTNEGIEITKLICSFSQWQIGGGGGEVPP